MSNLKWTYKAGCHDCWDGYCVDVRAGEYLFDTREEVEDKVEEYFDPMWAEILLWDTEKKCVVEEKPSE